MDDIHFVGPVTDDDKARLAAWLNEPAITAEAVQKRIDELREEAKDG